MMIGLQYINPELEQRYAEMRELITKIKNFKTQKTEMSPLPRGSFFFGIIYMKELNL